MIVKQVFSIEIEPIFAAAAQETCADRQNVSILLGDSRAGLRDLFKSKSIMDATDPILFYLDAHWLSDWPLREELALITARRSPFVIVIHDCMVPGTSFGYDTYNGVPLSFELVKPMLDKIRFKWFHRFNERADGHRRGVLFIEPCPTKIS